MSTPSIEQAVVSADAAIAEGHNPPLAVVMRLRDFARDTLRQNGSLDPTDEDTGWMP